MARTIPKKIVPYIQNPSRVVPHARWANANWIMLTPREITSQKTINRGLPTLGRKGTIFRFIAPEEIADVQNHIWEEYESLQKRLADKVRDFAKIGEEAKALKKLGVNVAKEAISANRQARSVLNSIAARGAGTDVLRAKVDTPLVYENSERREFTLTFNLVNIALEDDIVGIVKLLQQYAAPETKDEGIFFEPPYVFSVQSQPDVRLVDIKYAALTSIQVTYNSPYRFGTPARADLSLTFRDMEPLFANTIKLNSLINIIAG